MLRKASQFRFLLQKKSCCSCWSTFYLLAVVTGYRDALEVLQKQLLAKEINQKVYIEASHGYGVVSGVGNGINTTIGGRSCVQRNGRLRMYLDLARWCMERREEAKCGFRIMTWEN